MNVPIVHPLVAVSFRGFSYFLLMVLLCSCGKVQFSTPTTATAANLCVPSENGDCGVTPADPGTSDPSTNPNSPPAIPVSETFTMRLTTKVDVLFVIDSSGSMNTERAELGRRLANFTSSLSGLDWQLCVTTTDINQEKGDLLNFTVTEANGTKRLTKVLTAADPNYTNSFLDRIVNVPSGSGDEQGIRALNMAVSKRHPECFRTDAALAAIILSDEDERSVGGYEIYKTDSQYAPLNPENMPVNLLTSVRTSFGADKIFTGHSIVVQSNDTTCLAAQRIDGRGFYGTWYEELTRLTGGQKGSICSADYSASLGRFAENIRQALDSVTLRCVPLDKPQVTLAPAQPNVTISTSGNKVLFSPALQPDTSVTVSYRCAGGTI
ncbi:MAG: hypothetical protein NDI61_00125 [Bdellovibrionaceae bacterium]|nr:hypothetical protein [Pseudobdellovibrionaceae bacterium]